MPVFLFTRSENIQVKQIYQRAGISADGSAEGQMCEMQMYGPLNIIADSSIRE